MAKVNFTFKPTNKEVVFKMLNVNTMKAGGLDNFTGKFLKDGVSALVSPITGICNLSIKLITLLDKCKPAKLKHLFKKGSITEAKNY